MQCRVKTLSEGEKYFWGHWTEEMKYELRQTISLGNWKGRRLCEDRINVYRDWTDWHVQRTAGRAACGWSIGYKEEWWEVRLARWVSSRSWQVFLIRGKELIFNSVLQRAHQWSYVGANLGLALSEYQVKDDVDNRLEKNETEFRKFRQVNV